MQAAHELEVSHYFRHPIINHLDSPEMEDAWEQCKEKLIYILIDAWLSDYKEVTSRTYKDCIRQMARGGFINPMMKLQDFAKVPHEVIISQIKALPHLAETTKQLRGKAYVSFTGYLSMIFREKFRKAKPRKGTFFEVHEVVKTNALNRVQWEAFFVELKKINKRDWLVARVTLQGAKRIEEVLSLDLANVLFEKKQILFKISKTGGLIRQTVITYPQHFMDELKAYVGGRRDGLLFVTRNNTRVHSANIRRSFLRAGFAAKMPFRITPHVLKATAITYMKQQGYHAEEIQRMTGHASIDMVNRYDKTSREDNPTKYVSLV